MRIDLAVNVINIYEQESRVSLKVIYASAKLVFSKMDVRTLNKVAVALCDECALRRAHPEIYINGEGFQDRLMQLQVPLQYHPTFYYTFLLSISSRKRTTHETKEAP